MKQPLLKNFLALTFLAATTTLSAQSQCNNRDFEDTTFVGWSAATGTNQNGILQPVTWTNGFVSNGNNAAVNDASAQQTLITTNFIDQIAIDPATMQPDTQMTSLAPGGGFASVRLGNSINGFGCEKMSYQFTVTPRNQYFQFQFASVMEDPAHQWDAQPYFMVNFYDQAGNVVASVSDTIWAGDPAVPYIVSGNNPMILYRRWTPLSKDLSAYIGQNMTVEFVNSDCMFGGHFGYTYVDVSCLGTGVPNVWPGDCDYDLQANNVDLLTLGVTFGATGTTRAAATNSWIAQVSADWTQSVPLGANYKHSDCNGDGTVDLDDTLAITLNYSQGHPFRLIGPGNETEVQTAPTLYLQAVSDTIPPAGIGYVDVYLANAAMPVSDLYGLAFTLGYDNALVQSGSAQTSFNGSIVGVKNQSMITIAHDDYATGANDIALCRMNHTEINGYGYVGTMQFTAANVSTVSTLPLAITDVHAINAQMVTIPLMAQGTNIVIDPAASVPTTPAPVHIGLYPNPATDNVVITTVPDQSIEITNTLGQVVYTTTATSTATTIDLNNFDAGVYFVSVYTGSAKVTEQLIVE
jgi:hypothetical protein